MAIQPRRSSRLRTLGSILTATAVVVGGLALRSSTPAHAAQQVLIVARDTTDAKTMDPGWAYEFTDGIMIDNCYDTLVTFHGTDIGHLLPDLATSWSVSKDGKVYTFHLRHGVRFSSGNPMTADDVVFSLQRLKNLNGNPAPIVANMSGIKALDTYTVQITTSVVDASFLSELTATGTSIIDSKLVKAHGGDDSPQAATKDKAKAFLDTQSAGTGPFMMTNWTRNVKVVMDRNPNYWGPHQALDQIVMQNVRDAATQRLLVQKGSVDMAMGLNTQQALALQGNPNVQIIKGNTLDEVYVAMTTSPLRSKPLSNKLVRQAVRYAIDYDGILKGLLKGVGIRSATMFPVGLIGNDPATNKSLLINQDLAKARALLKQAGYPNGFSVTMGTWVGATFDGVTLDPIAAKLQNDLARVGIKLTLDPEQFDPLVTKYRAQQLQMILLIWGIDYPDPNDYAYYFSPNPGKVVATRMYYTWDKNLTKIVTEADSTSDVATRAALYKKVQQIWLDESPWIALVQPQQIEVLGSNVKGYVFSSIYGGGWFHGMSKS